MLAELFPREGLPRMLQEAHEELVLVRSERERIIATKRFAGMGINSDISVPKCLWVRIRSAQERTDPGEELCTGEVFRIEGPNPIVDEAESQGGDRDVVRVCD